MKKRLVQFVKLGSAVAVITAMLFPASVLAQTESDTSRVEEVVVTALGIKKEKKKLGYACLLYTSPSPRDS